MKPIIVKRSTIYLIWVIPIIAIIISGIMLFNEYARMGESVIIVFKDVRGIKQDETPVKYKGIYIGVVKDIEVDPENLNRFVITAKIKKSFVKYLTEGARFWKVSPKLKPTEFTGLSTIFSGTYIEFSPATSDPKKLSHLKAKRKFNGFEEEPKTNVTYFKLYGEDGSLIEGAPVLYKNFIVGNITKKALKGKKIEYVISINNEFAPLVKVDSNFWKISPVDIKASLPDFQLKVNNAFNFFFGGIQFDSPENSTPVCLLDKNSKEFQICNRKGFYLFPSRIDTEYSLKKIRLILKDAHKIQASLKIVYYKGDVAGKVVSSNYLVDKDMRYLYVRMKKKYADFLNYKSVFWIEKPSLDNINLQSIIKGTHIEFSFYNKRDKPRDDYILFHSRPFGNVKKIVLQSSSETGLKVGDYIFFGRKIIGEVVSQNLKDGKEEYGAIIYNEYRYLLNKNPVFYKKSGIEGEFSLDKIYFDISPLKGFFSGGVELYAGKGKRGRTGNVYPLFNNKRDAIEYDLLQSDGLKITLITKDIKGVYRGMPLYYGGVNIGKIYKIDFDSEREFFLLNAFIKGDYRKLVKGNSVFYKSSGIDVKMGLATVEIKTESLVSLLKGAIILKNYGKSNSPEKKEYRLYSLDELEKRDYVEAYLIADDAYGLKVESPVIYRGVVIGKVKGFSIENKDVKVSILINKNYSFILTSKTRFFIESTKVAAGEVKNLSSSIFGSVIKVAYSKSPEKKNLFELAGVNPSDTVYLDGFRIIIITPEIVSLSVGSPVLNKGVKIGEVEDIGFTDNLKKVKLTVFIENKYRDIVRETSEFREIKPISMKAGFIYAKVNFKSISSIIKGGLELINRGETIKKVQEWHRFYIVTNDRGK